MATQIPKPTTEITDSVIDEISNTDTDIESYTDSDIEATTAHIDIDAADHTDIDTNASTNTNNHMKATPTSKATSKTVLTSDRYHGSCSPNQQCRNRTEWRH